MWSRKWSLRSPGIVASRIVEIEGKPTIVFTTGNVAGTLTGSMRSIPEVDAKTLLDEVNNNRPGVLIRYGGHTGACGMTIPKEEIAVFSRELQEVYRKTYPWLDQRLDFSWMANYFLNI